MADKPATRIDYHAGNRVKIVQHRRTVATIDRARAAANELAREKPGLLQQKMGLGMDGQGRWIDNVFVERLWKSVKYEHVHLHAYESITEARQQLAGYFTFYNSRRPHSSLGGVTPDTAYFGKLATKLAA